MDDLQAIRSAALARLMTSRLTPPAWAPGELADVLRHQLCAPLVFDLRRGDADRPQGPPIRSFGDLLAHPTPPLELLGLTKEFGKCADRLEDGPLPPEVATVLYFGSLAAALVRHGRRIGELDDPALRKGFAWAAAQPWVAAAEPALIDLFRAALEALG